MKPKSMHESSVALAYWDVPVFAEYQEVTANRVDASIVNRLSNPVITLGMSFPWIESSTENDIHFISGLAIIPIDAKKLRRRSGILKYRPFTSEETECSSLGGSVCQIVVGNTDAFAVTPYDLENENGEYILKLPEKGISFKTWTELTGGGANSSSLHPRGAVFLRHGKAVGFLTFLDGKIKSCLLVTRLTVNVPSQIW